MPVRPRATQPTKEPVEHVFPAYGVDVFESHHASGWQMPEVAHDFLKIVLVHDGKGRLESGTSGTPCAKGDALVIGPGVTHRIVDDDVDPLSLYVVSLRRNVLEAAALDVTVLPSGVVALDPHTAEKIERGMRRLLFEQSSDAPTTGAQMVALALRVLVDLARLSQAPEATSNGPTAAPRIVRGSDSTTRMRAYVEDLSENFFEATNLDAAASALGLSRRRFTQLFREVTGSSWLSHVRALRIEHAKRLLESTDRTVLSVAFECGFEDLSTFYRAFKRETDESPNKWRQARDDSEADARTEEEEEVK